MPSLASRLSASIATRLLPEPPSPVGADGAIRRDLTWWRSRLLEAILASLAVLGFLAWLPTAIIAARAGEWLIVAGQSLAYVLVLIAWRARGLGFRWRAVAVLAVCWLLGVFLVVGWGPVSAGGMFLLALPVLAAVLFGLRGSLWGLTAVTVTSLAIGIAVRRHWLPWAQADEALGQLPMFAARTISALFIAALLSLSIAALAEGLAREVAARGDAERSREELATAVEQSGELIVLADQDGRVRYANALARSLAAPDRADFAGETLQGWLTTLSDGGGTPRDAADVWRDVLAGRAWSGTAQFLDPLPPMPPDFTIAGTLTPIRGDDGAVRAVLAVFRDVRRERRLEEQLRHSSKLQAIGTLVSGIAHDFNNLLQPILLDAELLRARVGADDEAHALLDDVTQSAQRGRELIRRILTFTREADLQRAPILLEPVVQETMRLIRATVPTTITIDWQCERDLVVVADGGELQQVLLNLATNAAHAMSAGGRLSVSVARVRVDDDAARRLAFPHRAEVVEISVADTGTGMDAATLSRIFEPFFTTKPPGSGTGLGLATVHGTITSLGGVVVPDSTPGRGTTMRLLLPLASAGQKVREPTPRSSAMVHVARRILLVDDEPAVLRAATRLLQHAGHAVTPCEDPRDAVRTVAAAATPFDCVVTDLSMPHLTGLELAARLREHDHALPVVLATGYLDHADLSAAPDVGIARVLLKPFARDALLDAVESVARAAA